MFEYELNEGVAILHAGFQQLNISSDPTKGLKPIELLVSSIVGCS